MRVLVSTVPGLGHFHPMVPLCRALVAAGHDVLVAAPQRFLPVVARCGLDGTAVRPDWLEEDADATFPGFRSGGPRFQLETFTRPPELGLVDDLVQRGRTWRADVVLHDHTEVGGWLAAELLGVPNVPYAMTVRLLDPGVIDMATGPRLDELLERFGLPPDPDRARPTRWLYLDSIPPSFAGMLFPPGPSVRSIRYETEDRSGEEQVPGWLDTRGDRPLVYVTLGTVFNQASGLLRTLVLGAADLDVDVLVTTGRNVDPSSLGSLPAQVRVERYVPQRELLPRCDAVVCHGGFNTVFGALSVGVPVVTVPLSADQPLNASLCELSGLGRSITTELMENELFAVARPEDVTPGQVTQALHAVLTEPSYRQAAGRLQQEIEGQAGVDQAVPLLEQLVREASGHVAQDVR